MKNNNFLCVFRWSSSKMYYQNKMSSQLNCHSLYKLCLDKFVDEISFKVNSLDYLQYIKLLPPAISSDIYKTIVHKEKLRGLLVAELTDINLFCKLLKSSQDALLEIFKVFIVNKISITNTLQQVFTEEIQTKLITFTSDKIDEQFWNYIFDGLRLGTFFSETGWLDDAIKVLNSTKLMIIQLDDSYEKQILLVNCYKKLLHAQSLFCLYKEASITAKQALNLIDKLKVIQYDGKSNNLEGIPDYLIAEFYNELSLMCFNRSEYETSFKWGLRAIEYLSSTTPPKIICCVFRQIAKTCIVNKKFQLACQMINNAMKTADEYFGRNTSIYADTLSDKGFLLLNIDSIKRSVIAYKEATNIQKDIYGDRSLNVAMIYEDLAYALYVREYSSGRFDSPRYFIEQAIKIMQEIAPNNEIMLASAKRVKALILEEIALDNIRLSEKYKNDLLKESEELHRTALNLSLNAFGENNVQTAKQYGNLGRLYQSMQRYIDAEDMHKRAIKIKIEILGDCDYEVGLSIGHLASLYNYQMNKLKEAEELYLESIKISVALFGLSYSGLEYDYRGLLHIYEKTHDFDNYMKFSDLLDEWKMNRSDEKKKTIVYEDSNEMTMDEIKSAFSINPKYLKTQT